MMDSDDLKWTIDFYEKNATKCNEIVQNLESFEGIPILTKDNFQSFGDGDFVRYQGMVQDILNPEYYCARCNGVREIFTEEDILGPGKFTDNPTPKENEKPGDDGSVTKERSVYFVIPIPGTSSWVQDTSVKTETSENKSSNKRPAEESDYADLMCGDDVIPDRGTKIKRIDVYSGKMEISEKDYHYIDKYFPLPEKNDLPCLVKIYENDEDEKKEPKIILNDRIEVIGFLSLNPTLENILAEFAAEEKGVHTPPSLVPRIHALRYRKLTHNNPLINNMTNMSEIVACADKIRSDLHLLLTQIFFGDNLAADYMICFLLSKIYSRTDEKILGSLSLNLYNIKTANYGRRLYDILKNLVTNSQYMPLSIEFLNENTLVPKKDYDSNRLWSGRLQLADDTYLILDETMMNIGKLVGVGCLNITALQKLLRDHEVRYDFSYYDIPYHANFSVVILSEGQSMFQTDIRLKIKTNASKTETANVTFDVSNFLSAEACDAIRKYLTCMKLQEFEMSEEVRLKIVDDYVKMRQQRTGINSFDLHNLITLSRFLAVSHGRTSLAPEDWSRALEMETERKARLLDFNM